MARVAVSSSVRVEAPEGVKVTPRTVPVAGAGLAAAAGAPADTSLLGQGLAEAGFQLVADFDLRPAAQPSLGAAASKVRVKVDVKAQENAVLLVEAEGGVYAWSFPAARQPKAAGLGLAASGGLPAGTLIFDIAPSEGQGAALALSIKGLRGSPIWDWVVGRAVGAIRARVLKFVVGKIEHAIVERIEGKLKAGLTSLAKDEPKRWGVGDSSVPKLEAANKVLLMVHGTFSTTAGSFSALTANDGGKAFLKAARGRYDAVLGFDHRTLAHGVDQNANDMMQVLTRLPQGAHVDAVAYSRGGLVYRVLAEELLAAQRPDIKLGKCAFVGCTNGGTHLAEPDNWASMVDIYTNVALAAARFITRLAGPGAAPAGVIASRVIELLGKFVQYLSVVAIHERRVPGLADMEPDSALVKRLNSATGGDERIADYYAITSNFVPRLDLKKGITKELQEMLLERVTNRLFKVDNDLVVDTKSMINLGGRQARLQEAHVFNYGDVEDIYHTVYFGADETARKLNTWLLT